jgi:hypothetical protein
MSTRVLLVTLILCVFARRVEGQSAPLTLLFSPAVLEVGTSTVIDLLIDCQVESCAAVDLTVHYDAQIVRIDHVTLGEFPLRSGHSVQILDNQIETGSSTFTLRYITLTGSTPPNRGRGVLAQLSVTALAAGLGRFYFVDAVVAAQDGMTVYWPQTLEGTVIVEVAARPRTVSVVAEASSPEQVIVSGSGSANLTVTEHVVGTALEIAFDPQSSIVIDAPGHLACAVTSATEAAIILRAGDVNDDGQIDLLDAALVGIAVNQNQPGLADVNGDQRVDIYDLIAVGRNYGRHSGGCG